MRLLRRILGWIPLRTFDRYIIRQFLSYTVIAVLVLSVVVVLGAILKELLDLWMRQAMPLGKIVQVVAAMFPNSLPYTIPWGTLVAALLVFGRISADNELTAMRMAGVSLFRICLPVFLLTGLLAWVAFYINTEVAPRAYQKIKKLRHSIALENPVALFEEGNVVDLIPGYIVYCDAKEDGKLKNFQAMALNDWDPPDPLYFIMASEVDAKPDLENKSLELVMHNLTTIQHSLEAVEEDGKRSVRLSMKGVGQSAVSPRPVDLTSLFEKANRPRVDAMSMDELSWIYAAADSRDKRRTGSHELLASYLKNLPEKDRKRLRSEAKTEFNNRHSFSLAAITLGLVGICYGITAQRRETLVGFALSLVIALTYFAILTVGAILKDKPQYRPELWVWLPNVAFGLLGIFLFWRHHRR